MSDIEKLVSYAKGLFEANKEASVVMADVIYSLRDGDFESIEELVENINGNKNDKNTKKR